MRALVALSILTATAWAQAKPVTLTADEQQAVMAAYKALQPPAPDNKKIDKLPDGDFARIDVSPRLRSASFGHKTWLVVPKRARRFYIEYGKSTNTPPAFFGPFDVPQKPE